MTDEDIINPCIHCAIFALIEERIRHGIKDTQEELIVRLVEIVYDIPASFNGGRRIDLLAFFIDVTLQFTEQVRNYQWKGDVDAGPGTDNIKRH